MVVFAIEKNTKHDSYVEALCEQISQGYDSLHTHVPIFSKKKRRVAEIDIMAVKGDMCDIFEVKCSFRIVKARQQLAKIKKNIKRIGTSEVRYSFFYCGESGMLVNL
ncbi:MAG: hypothetical protein ACLFTH_04190 [Candidatus Woesearchaeota archaeon]